MTCKDCYHYDVCKFKELEGVFADLYAHINEKAEGNCNDFKDKSTILELPCKVGDTAYVIRYFHSVRRIQSGTIGFLNITADGKLYAEVKYVGRGRIGEKVFLTREEAEAALEGMKNG